jgi:hypothetical protein
MTADYRAWPDPARAMARHVHAAVSAAQSANAAEFDDELAALKRVDREQLAVFLGAITRDLLERSYPDGLDSDDAEQLLARCLRSASWYGQLDRDSLTWALTGALGIIDPDESPQAIGPAVVAHGLLLIAELLAELAQEPSSTLESALRELMRAQTIELP